MISYETLWRCHNGAARARDVAVANAAEDTEASRSAERLAEEQNEMSTDKEERRRLDRAEKFA